ncbi:MAG: 50S ribosomal protein L22 [Patescibacteria group bacterium]
MKAFLKNYRQAPRKVRLVANLVRGKKLDRVLTLLSAADKKSALPLKKLIESAIANAKSAGTKTDDFILKEIQVNEGIVFKRFMPRARGRASAIRKKTSHVSIVLGKTIEKNKESRIKNNKRKKKNDDKKEIKPSSVTKNKSKKK